MKNKSQHNGRLLKVFTIISATGGILGLVGGTFAIAYTLTRKDKDESNSSNEHHILKNNDSIDYLGMKDASCPKKIDFTVDGGTVVKWSVNKTQDAILWNDQNGQNSASLSVKVEDYLTTNIESPIHNIAEQTQTVTAYFDDNTTATTTVDILPVAHLSTLRTGDKVGTIYRFPFNFASGIANCQGSMKLSNGQEWEYSFNNDDETGGCEIDGTPIGSSSGKDEGEFGGWTYSTFHNNGSADDWIISQMDVDWSTNNNNWLILTDVNYAIY